MQRALLGRTREVLFAFMPMICLACASSSDDDENPRGTHSGGASAGNSGTSKPGRGGGDHGGSTAKGGATSAGTGGSSVGEAGSVNGGANSGGGDAVGGSNTGGSGEQGGSAGFGGGGAGVAGSGGNQTDTRCYPNSVGAGFDRLASQRAVALDTPLNRVQWLGAHNAWNDSGAVWANQRWTTEKLLDAGVRSFDLDLHRDSSGTVRLCHSDCSAIYGAKDDYGAELDKYKTFLDKNSCEILFIDLEDRVNDEEDVVGPLRARFGPALYAPQDKPTERWETPREMIARGKRVIIKSANVVYPKGVVWDGKLFANNAPPGYNYEMVKDFGTDACTSAGKALSVDKLYGVYDSKIGKGLLIDNLVEETGTIDAGNIPKLLKCGLNFVDADRWDDAMIAASVWSWASGEPNGQTAENCAELAGGGRWNDVDCSNLRNFACESTSQPGTFHVTKAQGVWADGDAACLKEFPGSRFSLPQNALQNAALVSAAGAARVWLKLSDISREGVWQR